MIGVVAHDAGGAEILSSYIRQRELSCLYCLDGAARAVFERKLGRVDTIALEELVAVSDEVLCGTSFLSDLEWRAIGLAKEAGKNATTVLDHWVNYRQRFVRNDEWHFPDEVWVGDALAESIAQAQLPEVRISLVPNPYFLDLKEQLATLAESRKQEPRNPGLRVLYVSEPLREDGLALHGDERYWGYTEEEALRYFLSNAHALDSAISLVVIRPHPQESADKYAWAEKEFNGLPIVSGRAESLLEQVVASDVVIGGATMAMVVGLLAGKRVIACTPPGSKAELLPQAEIESFADLLDRANDAGGRRSMK
jgi:hypothetical protein